MALKGMDSIELEENIYPIDAIDQELARNLTIDKLFDVYRFVDMRTHLVHDYNDGKMCEPCRKCYELWNRSKPCPNCSSERAVQQKKQIMKMEYLGDKSILILSTPWEQDGKEYVLELGRDVTNSFSVYDATSEDSSELRELISSYSELAARDSFTGLYSKGHANNLLQEMFAVQKEQLKLTLALIDIDHFKSVNDRFGHLCGDEVILYVVDKINALNEQCSGWAARIGGDDNSDTDSSDSGQITYPTEDSEDSSGSDTTDNTDIPDYTEDPSEDYGTEDSGDLDYTEDGSGTGSDNRDSSSDTSGQDIEYYE